MCYTVHEVILNIILDSLSENSWRENSKDKSWQTVSFRCKKKGPQIRKMSEH